MYAGSTTSTASSLAPTPHTQYELSSLRTPPPWQMEETAAEEAPRLIEISMEEDERVGETADTEEGEAKACKRIFGA